MILDERTYTVMPELVREYLRLYADEGMAIQVSHLGELVGWFTTDSGVVNQVVHSGATPTQATANAAAPPWTPTRPGRRSAPRRRIA